MSDINTVTVTGRVTRDPEMRFTPSGVAVATFSVAVNKSKLDKGTNTWDEETSFFDVVCFTQLAENVVESVAKGDSLLITGRLKQSTWKTKTGENRSKIEITADSVAPNLRWATAATTRPERTASPRGGYAPNEEPF